MSAKRRVIVIGVDGATFDLIEPWVAQGRLPNLERLMKGGTWGRLQSTIPPVTPCAWTSFKTGVNPGKHGIFDFYMLDEERNLHLNFSRYRGYKSIWKILSENGSRCCIYNVPFTFPPEPVNGILISGLLTPSLRANFTFPPEFKKELLQAIPHFRIFGETRFSEREEDASAFFQDLLRLVEMRHQATKYLLEQEEWDFFMMVFTETDPAQHWFWKFMDPLHPDFDEAAQEKFGHAIFQVYHRVDECIGEILKHVDEETLFLIMSDHGAGRFIRRIYINNWLKKEGYLFLKKSPTVFLKRLFYAIGLHPQGIINLIFRMGLARYDTRVSMERKRSLFSKIGYTFDDLDWKRTRAFSFGSYGQIYLNSVENYEDGIVNREDVGHMREEIVERLKQVIDVDRGIRILDKVWYREEIYEGPRLHLLPDITLSLDNFSYTSSTLFTIPSNDIFSKPLTRKSGDHRIDGVFMAYGDGVRKGHLLERPSILDVAPTILEYLGVQVPSEMDGKPLREIYA